MVATAVAQSQALVGGRVATRQQRPRVVRVAALQQEAAAPAAPLRFLAAGLAAAALATATPAYAGVVLVQPEVKNFVKGTEPAKKSSDGGSSKAAPAKKAAKKAEEASAPGGGFDGVRPFVLPLALLAVGGAGVAASKADPEFAALMDQTWSAKDSISTGAGYETAAGMKDGPMFGGSNTASKPAKTGTAIFKKAKTVSGKPASKKKLFG